MTSTPQSPGLSCQAFDEAPGSQESKPLSRALVVTLSVLLQGLMPETGQLYETRARVFECKCRFILLA